jgi:hypothetical protein
MSDQSKTNEEKSNKPELERTPDLEAMAEDLELEGRILLLLAEAARIGAFLQRRGTMNDPQ